MQQLNLPEFEFKTKDEKGKRYIFDTIRKKYVVLTPEEWVRQNFVRYLVNYKNFSASLLILEMPFTLNKTDKRSDIAAYNKNGKIVLLVECKSPDVAVSQKVFDQVATYNLKINAPFLALTNGITHYCCKLDYKLKKWVFVNEIPDFGELESIGAD